MIDLVRNILAVRVARGVRLFVRMLIIALSAMCCLVLAAPGEAAGPKEKETDKPARTVIDAKRPQEKPRPPATSRPERGTAGAPAKVRDADQSPRRPKREADAGTPSKPSETPPSAAGNGKPGRPAGAAGGSPATRQCRPGWIERDGSCRRILIVTPSRTIQPLPVDVTRHPPADDGTRATLVPTSPLPTLGAAPPLPPVARQPRRAAVAVAEFEPDEVLVTVPASAPPSLDDGIARSFGLLVVERTAVALIDARLVRLRIPDRRAVPAVVAALQADARVGAAQPNYLYIHQGDPAGSPTAVALTQPAAVAVPGLQYALAKLGVTEAHRRARGHGARIGVLDSSVDRAHPDLAAAHIEHFDAASGGDDVSGTKSVSADESHGTAIAGIIAARGTLQGVAPEAKVLSASVFRAGKAGAPQTATSLGLLKGLDWAVARGARIVNMSLAGPRDAVMEKAVMAARAKRVIMVAAAGNGGADARPAFPAAYAGVIAVTAIDADDRLYEMANRGSYIAIAAPGVDILVAGGGQAHQFESGTSFAAAHVSGIIALMLELDPDMPADAVLQALVAGATDLGDPGPDHLFGAGRINAAATLRLMVPAATVTQP